MRRLMAIVLAAIEALAYVIDWTVDAAGRLVHTMRRHATGYAGPDPAAVAAAEQADADAALADKQSGTVDGMNRAADPKIRAVHQAATLALVAKCKANGQTAVVADLDRADTRLWIVSMTREQAALLSKGTAEQLLAIVRKGPAACTIPGLHAPTEADLKALDAKALAGAERFKRESLAQAHEVFKAASAIYGGRDPDLSNIQRDDIKKWLKAMPAAEALSLALADDSHRLRIAALGPSACEIPGVYTPPTDNVHRFRQVYRHKQAAPASTEAADDGGVQDVLDWCLKAPGAR